MIILSSLTAKQPASLYQALNIHEEQEEKEQEREKDDEQHEGECEAEDEHHNGNCHMSTSGSFSTSSVQKQRFSGAMIVLLLFVAAVASLMTAVIMKKAEHILHPYLAAVGMESILSESSTCESFQSLLTSSITSSPSASLFLSSAYISGAIHPDPTFDIWHNRCPAEVVQRKFTPYPTSTISIEEMNLPSICRSFQWSSSLHLSAYTSSTYPAMNLTIKYNHCSSSQCCSLCSRQWFDRKGPDVLDARRAHTREYIAAFSFKDMADVIWGLEEAEQWHGERGVDPQKGNIKEILSCLPPGAILNIDSTGMITFCELFTLIQVPFILLTGRADKYGIEDCPGVLDHPMLLHAFAQNVPKTNPSIPLPPSLHQHKLHKVSVIPIGINGIEHHYIHQYLTLKHVKHEQAVMIRTSRNASSSAPSSSKPPVPLSGDSALSRLTDLSSCSQVNADPCTTEQSHLRQLLRLDEYVYSQKIHQLNVDSMKSDVSADRIRSVFATDPVAIPVTYIDSDSPATVFRGNHRAPTPDLEREILSFYPLDNTNLSELNMSNNISPFNLPSIPFFALYGRWSKLAVLNVNIGTNPKFRQPLHDQYCEEGGKHRHWITCIKDKLNGGNSMYGDNPRLLNVYSVLAQYMYWFSPPGNGLDCHRTWEALYVGSIPIIQRSSIDPLFLDADLPVLLVDDMKKVTMEYLLEQAPRFANLERDFPRRKLLRSYWYNMIKMKRKDTLNLFTALNQSRFWIQRSRQLQQQDKQLVDILQPSIIGVGEEYRQEVIQAFDDVPRAIMTTGGSASNLYDAKEDQSTSAAVVSLPINVLDIWDTDRERRLCWGPAKPKR